MAAIFRLTLAVTIALFALNSVALAQGAELTGFLEAGLAVQGKGWLQLTNFGEMGEFVLGIVEITAMTAVIAYHPASRAKRRTAFDFQMPRTLFAYALIGMVVGFLVVNHGYVIGFVIFGLGGLLRFRNSVETAVDTAKYILVTLMGLSVGINLPVMALIITISAWLIMFFLGKVAFLTLEVRFSEEKPINQSMEELLAQLDKQGFKTVTVTKSKFKPNVELVLSGVNHATRVALMREMIALQMAKSGTVVDWHLD